MPESIEAYDNVKVQSLRGSEVNLGWYRPFAGNPKANNSYEVTTSNWFYTSMAEKLLFNGQHLCILEMGGTCPQIHEYRGCTNWTFSRLLFVARHLFRQGVLLLPSFIIELHTKTPRISFKRTILTIIWEFKINKSIPGTMW